MGTRWKPIVAIADVYDALTSNRIYRKAQTHKNALEIIINDSGKHFDPYVVDVFIVIEAEFDRIREKLLYK